MKSSLPISMALAFLAVATFCPHPTESFSWKSLIPNITNPVQVWRPSVHLHGNVVCNIRGQPIDQLTVRLFDRTSGNALASRKTDAHGKFEIYVEKVCKRVRPTMCDWQTDVVVTHTCNAEGAKKYVVVELPDAKMHGWIRTDGYNVFKEDDIDLANAEDEPWYYDRVISGDF
jgi:Transthyretin-like family